MDKNAGCAKDAFLRKARGQKRLKDCGILSVIPIGLQRMQVPSSEG
jgi:hypothetical protein